MSYCIDVWITGVAIRACANVFAWPKACALVWADATTDPAIGDPNLT